MKAIINSELGRTIASATQTISRSDMNIPTPSNVSVIPATKPTGQNAQLKARTDINVAAYCRVSTGDESQQTSYKNQKAYYSGLIHSHHGWRFAGIYADEGISGTSVAHRDQFNQMMQDAREGKIDYIVTKSISRFARNTLDMLTYVRELKELNPKVGVYFEKENVDTLNLAGEMVMTVLAAIAQEESHSISENIRWSIQKKFQAGIPQINLERMLGYDKGEKGLWVINEEQAGIVRDIFARYIGGIPANRIAQGLNDAGILTVAGKQWSASAILRILRNEKYVGDLEMQKTYTEDFLTHKARKNSGEMPKYYYENHHIPIIDRRSWDMAQERLLRKAPKEKVKPKRGAERPAFANLRCSCKECPYAATCSKAFNRLTYSNAVLGYTDERSIAATGADPGLYLEEYYYSHPVWKCRDAGGNGADKGGNGGGKDKTDGDKDGIDGNKDRTDGVKNICPAGVLNECSLKQSFMEMLYKIKRDYEANGEQSKICIDFASYYEKLCRNSVEVTRLASKKKEAEALRAAIEKDIRRQAEAMRAMLLNSDADLSDAVESGEVDRDDILQDIRNGLENPAEGPQFYKVEVPEDSEAGNYAAIVRDLRSRLEELEAEVAELETSQNSVVDCRRNFDAFLRILTELPEKNGAGMEILVNGLDTDGSILREADGKVRPGKRSTYKKGRLVITPERIAQAPDYLTFEEPLYRAFITEGIVRPEQGDEGLKMDRVDYKTIFGLTLTTTRNSRTVGSFLGFRRSGVGKDGLPNGTVEFLDMAYKVDGGKVRYKRSERKRRRKDETSKEKEE